MQYKRFEDTIVLRLDPGEEVVQSIKDIAVKENIKLASLTGIGSTNDLEAGVFNLVTKKYDMNVFKEPLEITSLVGNINTMNDEVYTHIHINATGVSGNAVGGHLNKAVISLTSEIFITVINGRVDRTRNEELQLNALDFDK